MAGHKYDTYPRMMHHPQPYIWEYLFTSLIIDAGKDRYVPIFDIPGAYPNTDMPKQKFITLNIEGYFVEIMYRLNPKQKKNVCMENSVQVI